MHASNTLCDIPKDLQDLGLRESVLEPCVHKVDQTSSAAKLHEQEDLVSAAIELAGMAVHVGYNVPVSFELLHGFHFRSHACQMVLIRDSDSLEYGDFMLIIVSWDSGNVDMSKATFGEVFFDYDPLAAYLNLGARQERTGGRIRGWRWCAVGGAAVWDGGRRKCHGEGGRGSAEM